MKSLSILVIAAAASVSTAAMAQDDRDDQAQAGEQTQANSDEDDAYLDKVVCKTERVTGSLTRVNRTCMTRREWNLASERTQREMRQWDRNTNKADAQTGPAGGIGPGGF